MMMIIFLNKRMFLEFCNVFLQAATDKCRVSMKLISMRNKILLLKEMARNRYQNEVRTTSYIVKSLWKYIVKSTSL
jgi:hypothetical protein